MFLKVASKSFEHVTRITLMQFLNTLCTNGVSTKKLKVTSKLPYKTWNTDSKTKCVTIVNKTYVGQVDVAIAQEEKL